MTPPTSQGFRYWGLTSTCGTTRTDAAGAHVNSPVSWTTRGEDHPTARLSGPGAGKVWHRVQELAGRARRRLPCGGANRDAGSLPGTARTPLMTSSKTRPACSMPFSSSSSPVMPQVRYVVASSKKRWGTADARVIPSTKSGFSCEPRVIGSPSVNKNASAQPSRQMRPISVSKSPTTAPSKSETSSIKTPPPKTDTWPLVSSSAYQRVPSPKLLAWAGPYANGRTPSWPTSTQPEPATAQPKQSTDIIELGRRTARGYRNPTNYQLRMLLTAGGLDASTHTKL